MRCYAFFFLFIITAFCTHCTDRAASINSPDQKTLIQGKLFLIGGGTRPEAMIERLAQEAGLDNGGYGIILPMASAEPDSAIYYGKKQFSDQGIYSIHGFNLAENKLKEAFTDSLENAALIYIAGGDQNRFMEFVEGEELVVAIQKAYRKGSVIAGTSAGAAVMGSKMITGRELKYPEYSPTFKSIEVDNLELAPGLDLISGVIIDQHFIQRSRHNRLLTAILEHPDYLGLGIDESTALLINGNEAEVIGESQVMVFRNPDHVKKQVNGKLGAKGLLLDIYLPGDSFLIR